MPSRTIVLTITPEDLGSYSVTQDGQRLASGRHAITTALFKLRMSGAWDDSVVVRNGTSGEECASFLLRDFDEAFRNGSLPLPASKREAAKRRREEKLRGLPPEPIYPPTTKPNLPPLHGRSGVWIDQRAKRSDAQVG